MFAFQPWHSAVEFRRYLHRFIHELPRINTLAGVDRTPYNQYDSIILPITTYLAKQGVDFRYDTKVVSLSYLESKNTTVSEIHIAEGSLTGVIHVHDPDIVMITLGSMTSASSQGTNTSPPPVPSPTGRTPTDGSWELWKSISQDSRHFGHPLNFCTRTEESNWESFTVTLRSPKLFEQIAKFTHNAPGTGALTTFKDSNWLLSIVIPHQPHFISQPTDVQVFWGYSLYHAAVGNFVHKPMSQCSGQEILTELMGHLRFPLHPTLETAITLPCSMPYITSQFLTRSPGDRPEVIPPNSTNLAFLGQFVEIPLDVVFTVEYSVRGAMLAVSGLMGLQKQPPHVYRGDHDPKVLAKALMVMLENGVGKGGVASEITEDWPGEDGRHASFFFPVVF
jgi:oleate hydratase